MNNTIKNINEVVGKSVIISGLPSELKIEDGSLANVIWVNDTHVELHLMSGRRLCLRTYVAKDVLYEK